MTDDSSSSVDGEGQAFDGKTFAARLPTRPGVYLMRDAEGVVLYVY